MTSYRAPPSAPYPILYARCVPSSAFVSCLMSFPALQHRTLGQVPVSRHRRIIDPLQILALNKTLDLFFDHRYVRLELATQLCQRLGNELCVGKLFALPVNLLAFIRPGAGP